MNVFMEGELIADSLRTVLPYVDGVILADGAYKDYPTEFDVSNDGTVERAKYVTKHEWNKEFHTITFPERHTEVDKRTAYLKYIQERMDWNHTWAFIWD